MTDGNWVLEHDPNLLFHLNRIISLSVMHLCYFENPTDIMKKKGMMLQVNVPMLHPVTYLQCMHVCVSEKKNEINKKSSQQTEVSTSPPYSSLFLRIQFILYCCLHIH